jgi:hypothetical protein
MQSATEENIHPIQLESIPMGSRSFADTHENSSG